MAVSNISAVACEVQLSCLEPPAHRTAGLKRARLVELLRKHLSDTGSVIGLLAPAGYGKTCLLRRVREGLLASRARVAWLSLIEAADSAECLMTYIEASLVEAGAIKRERQRSPSAAGLLNRLRHANAETYFVIDNLERIRSQPALDTLEHVIRNAPPTVRWMISGRRNPGLSLTPLLAERRLRLIEPAELAFTFAETADFVIGECQESPGAVALNEVYELTRGWAGLLSVMIGGLPSGQTLELAVQSGNLPEHQIASYISEEVLADLESDMRRVMEVLALVDQGDQELIRLALADEAVPELAAVAAHHPIVTLMGSGHFALHQAIRDVLKIRLRAEQPAHFRQLASRLARWALQKQDAPAAIDYCIEADDVPKAVSILEAEGRNIALSGFPNRCLHWLNRLHPETSVRPIGLMLTELWAHVTMHETRVAAKLLGSASLKGGRRRKPAIDIEVATAEAFNCAIADDPEAARDAVVAVSESARNMSPIVNAGCSSVLAWVQFSRGEFEKARQTLYQSGALDMQGQGLLTHSYAETVLGESFAAEGKLEAAESVFKRSVRVAEAARGRRSMVVVVTLAPLLDVLYERDRIDEVIALASGREHLRLKYSTPGSSMAGGVALANSLILRNSSAEAQHILDDMLLIGEEGRLARVIAHALAANIRVALREGRDHEVSEHLGRLEGLCDGSDRLLRSPQGVINFLADLSLLRVRVAHGEHELALQQAIRLEDRLRGLGFARIQLLVESIVAAIHWSRGDQEIAVKKLSRVIEEGFAFGVVRSIADQMSGRSLLAASELKTALPASLHGYLAQLIAAIPSTSPEAQNADRMMASGSRWTDATLAATGSDLTVREREVLFLLAQDISTKRLAQTLRVSPETAKWHIRNVYEKLGVHNRASARMAARRLQASLGSRQT